MYHEAKHGFESHGIMIKDLQFDIKKMMAQKDKAVKGLTAGVEGLLKKNKVCSHLAKGTPTAPPPPPPSSRSSLEGL